MLPSCCAKLEELFIINSSISDKGLISLCQKENNGDETHSLNLRVIDLSGITQINDGVSYLLKYMPSLQRIVYEDLDFVLSNIYKHDVHKASEDKYNLTSFTVPYSYTSNRFSPLQNSLCLLSMCCPFIKVLSVPIKSKQDLKSISKLSGLEDFSATDISPTHDLNLNWFLKQIGGGLKRIEIRQFSISVENLVESCPNLESFTFEGTIFLPDPNTNLKQLNNLYELHAKCILYDNNAKRAVWNILNLSPNLESLSFSYCDLKFPEEYRTEITKYCENSNLRILKFYDCAIYIAMLQTIILTCSSLKTLVLFEGHDIDSNIMKGLFQFPPSFKNKVEISYKDDRSFATTKVIKSQLQDINVNASERTVRRKLKDLNFKTCRPDRKPKLTPAMKAKCLQWAKQWRDKDVDFWRSNKAQFVRRRRGKKFHSDCETPYKNNDLNSHQRKGYRTSVRG
ncbi:uncharacterized protein TNCV_1818531 [Trichonephila clavipes]|nr:uncharacterized protein TNCV_1818531 [Trichonephila clavipes]